MIFLPHSFISCVAALLPPPPGRTLIGSCAAREEPPTQQKVLWEGRLFSPGADQANASGQGLREAFSMVRL